MSPLVVLTLARPTAAADRERVRLVTASTAAAGGLLLAAAGIARLPAGPRLPAGVAGAGELGGFAPYVAESGLRFGVVLGAALLVLPLLGLAVQALRVGSLARERRLASLRLAGATPGEVRTVAAAEAGGAALLGGVLAGPVYLLLWLALGALPPSGWRLVPTPTLLDLPVWVGLALLTGLAGGLAGATVHRRIVVEPLTVRRRATSHQLGRTNGVLLATGVALVAGTFFLPLPVLTLPALLIGLLLAAFAAGPRLVRRQGRRLAGSDTPARLLAGARLAAEPGPPGRTAGVLIVCGFVLGVEAVLVAQLLTEPLRTDDDVMVVETVDLDFYLVGFGLAAAATLLAALAALLTLFVGAVDQLLDAHRPLASLAALGVDDPVLLTALQHQQTATAIPAITLGAGAGGGLAALGYGAVVPDLLAPGLLAVLVVAGLAGLATAGFTRLTTRLLHPRLRAAVHPDNLRTA